MERQKSIKRSSFRMRISRRIRAGFVPVPQQESDPESVNDFSSVQEISKTKEQAKAPREDAVKKEHEVRSQPETSRKQVKDPAKPKQESCQLGDSLKQEAATHEDKYDLTVDSSVELGYSFKKKRHSFGSESVKRRGERFQRREIEKRKTILESEDSTDSDSHVCDFQCPLLTHGHCPNSKVKHKGQRRSSYTSSSFKEHSLASLSSVFGRPRPLVSLSIGNIARHDFDDHDLDEPPIRSPGLLSTASMWSTSDLRRCFGVPPKPEQDTVSHVGTASLSNVSGSFSERMHELVRAFSSRTQRAKEKISQPPTPSSDSDYDAKSAVSGADENQGPRNIRLGSFLPLGSQASDALSDENHDHFVGVWHCRFRAPRFLKKLRFPSTMEPHSKIYVSWLLLVSLAFMYNAVAIPLRGVFPYQTPENIHYWLIADYLCDIIYLLDILVFKCRLRFTNNGIIECNRRETMRHYMKKWMFKFDIMSLTPLDFFYFIKSVGVNPWLRLPRVLKIQTYWEFYERCDQASRSSAHAIRIVKTVTYMLFLIHVETCGYYAVSVYEGIGTNEWVYSGQGIAYIRCFYLATKTATSIGNNPDPTNKLEYIFMTFYWLSGVFVFALLIGQIRDIVEAAGMVKDNYRKKMDSCLWYMQSINLPREMKDRVREWFLYNWEQQKTIDERSLVCSLPKKLQTDLAINVHFNTLSKVQLFQDCERNLLYDLVLKLKPILYLPGDFICKKGEVGREMYIVTQGQVEVVGGENGETVLATLHEGSVFGEISLLAMSGRGNRRTADVRSKGYTNVFTLSKHDFEMAMTEYPDAQAVLKRRAKRLLRANAKMEKKRKTVEAEEIIKTPPETPKLVQTVIQVMDPDSNFVKQLNPSLKRSYRNLRRPHSKAHSHRLSTSTSDIHHLTPSRGHSFRLTSHPSSYSLNPSLTLDNQSVDQKNEGFDTDDENDELMFDDSSDDVSLSEVLHDALTISSFDDDDDDDDNGDDEMLTIERYGTASSHRKHASSWSHHTPQRQAENEIENKEKEWKKIVLSDDVDENRNGEATSRFSWHGNQNGGSHLMAMHENGNQKGDDLSLGLPNIRENVNHRSNSDKENGVNECTHMGSTYSPGSKSNSRMRNSPYSFDMMNQETEIFDRQEENHNKATRLNNGQVLQQGGAGEKYKEEQNWPNSLDDRISVRSICDDNRNMNVTTENMEALTVNINSLTLDNQTDSGQEDWTNRVRKLSVVSPPVSPRDKNNPTRVSNNTQFVSLKDNNSDLIMRCFTPVETTLMDPVIPNETMKKRASPNITGSSPVMDSSPTLTNGLDGGSGNSSLVDIPAENRITFAVDVHRSKSNTSSSTDIRGHKETAV